MNVLDKLTKARSLLVLDHPFFGALALKLNLIEDKRCPTACVNGKEIRYNPDWVESLTLKETLGLFAHEIMHLALGHPWRRGNRRGDVFNEAGDFIINNGLQETGFTLPSTKCIDSKYKDWATEEVYNDLLKQEEEKEGKGEEGEQGPDSEEDKDGTGSGKGDDKEEEKPDEGDDIPEEGEDDKSSEKYPDPGGCGGVVDAEGTEEERKDEEETWKASVSQAIQIGKGDLPSELQRLIKEENLDPPLPWFVLLRDFVERTARNDYSWSRPNPRYFSRNLVLPSLISDELPEVAIVIDTSGSIDEQALAYFAQEVSNVFEAYDTTLRVLHCDTKVHKEEEFTRADLPLSMKPVGGGGTNFAPAFEYIEEKGHTPVCMIYFTDMYGSFPDKAPDYPVMWVTGTKDKTAPFGTVVNFNHK